MCQTARIKTHDFFPHGGYFHAETIGKLIMHIGPLEYDKRFDRGRVSLRDCLCSVDIESSARMNGYSAKLDHALGEWTLEREPAA
jgi:hypothetical protein